MNCVACNKQYVNKNRRVKSCSNSCAQNADATYISCVVCCVLFRIKKSHSKRRKTCSKTCMSKYCQSRMIGQNNPNYKDAGRKTCKSCGKEFKSYSTPRLFCNNNCWGTYYFGDEYGSITPNNIIIRQSVEYKKWREAVFKRDNYKCVWCGQGSNLNADHIKPFSRFPALRLVAENGRTLCNPCHRKTDTWGAKAARR